MKKLLVGMMLGAVLLSGCGAEEVEQSREEKQVEEGMENNGGRFDEQTSPVDKTEIITDTKTGCKYIIITNVSGYGDTISMTPLMKNSTEVDCEVE